MKCLYLLIGLFALSARAQAADKLTIMLDWFVNPDHGPIIVAQQLGYFKEAGLEVEIIAPSDPSEPPKMVAAGKADIAVSYQPQLYLQHAAGLPLVRVGTLIDTPLYCVLAKADGPVRTLADLKGRKAGFSVPGVEQAILYAMLRHNGVQPTDVTMVNVNFSLVPALASEQTDAVSGAFRNFEPFQLEAIGQKGHCFKPEDNGVPLYDELIYEANPNTMNRDAVSRFLKASARAEATIRENPSTGWETFKSYSGDLDNALNKRAWAETVPHFASHPMAYDTVRYEAFGAFLQAAGLISVAPEPSEIAIDLSQSQ